MAKICGASLFWLWLLGWMPVGVAGSAIPDPLYEYRGPPNPHGIGKFFMGREISHVMGHRGASWLERSVREEEERTDLLVESLPIQPGDVVADIGAGTGYFSWRLAQRVGPKGKILAQDIQPEMLDILTDQMVRRGVADRVETILGTVTDPNLPPASCDLALMVDVYHEFDHPFEMVRALIRGLKPGGLLVFVEYRLEDPTVPIKRLHKMSEAQVLKEMSIQPLEPVETLDILPRQHIIIFRKSGEGDQNTIQ